MAEINNISLLKNIKSKYIMKQIFQNLQKIKFLNMIRYNKAIKNKMDIILDDYKECTNIEVKIDILDYDNFIFYRLNNEKNIHIYVNGNKKEINEKDISREEVKEIKIIIDYGIKSLEGLFKGCHGIKKINFIRFFIRDITNMSKMFYDCRHLEELDLSNFKTENVTDMSSMFANCLLLKKIIMANINTINVKDMNNMFYKCLSLEELNLSCFNTLNVTDMSCMFHGCSLLNKLNISNFNTNNATNIKSMFEGCSSLIELNLSNFNTSNVTNMSYLFFECKSLKKLIFQVSILVMLQI